MTEVRNLLGTHVAAFERESSLPSGRALRLSGRTRLEAYNSENRRRGPRNAEGLFYEGGKINFNSDEATVLGPQSTEEKRPLLDDDIPRPTERLTVPSHKIRLNACC